MILVDSTATVTLGIRTQIVEITFTGGDGGSVMLFGVPSLSDALGNEIVVMSRSPASRGP